MLLLCCGTFFPFLAGLGQKSSELCMLLCPYGRWTSLIGRQQSRQQVLRTYCLNIYTVFCSIYISSAFSIISLYKNWFKIEKHSSNSCIPIYKSNIHKKILLKQNSSKKSKSKIFIWDLNQVRILASCNIHTIM